MQRQALANSTGRPAQRPALSGRSISAANARVEDVRARDLAKRENDQKVVFRFLSDSGFIKPQAVYEKVAQISDYISDWPLLIDYITKIGMRNYLEGDIMVKGVMRHRAIKILDTQGDFRNIKVRFHRYPGSVVYSGIMYDIGITLDEVRPLTCLSRKITVGTPGIRERFIMAESDEVSLDDCLDVLNTKLTKVDCDVIESALELKSASFDTVIGAILAVFEHNPMKVRKFSIEMLLQWAKKVCLDGNLRKNLLELLIIINSKTEFCTSCVNLMIQGPEVDMPIVASAEAKMFEEGKKKVKSPVSLAKVRLTVENRRHDENDLVSYRLYPIHEHSYMRVKGIASVYEQRACSLLVYYCQYVRAFHRSLISGGSPKALMEEVIVLPYAIKRQLVELIKIGAFPRIAFQLLIAYATGRMHQSVVEGGTDYRCMLQKMHEVSLVVDDKIVEILSKSFEWEE